MQKEVGEDAQEQCCNNHIVLLKDVFRERERQRKRRNCKSLYITHTHEDLDLVVHLGN